MQDQFFDGLKGGRQIGISFSIFIGMKLLPGISFCKVLTFASFLFAFSGMAQSMREIEALKTKLHDADAADKKVVLLDSLVRGYAPLNFDSSYYYAGLLFQTALTSGNETYLIVAYRAKGLAFDFNYNRDSAYYFYQKAVEKSIELNDTLNMAITYFNLGTLELVNGSYISVLPWYEQAMEYFETMPDNKYHLSKIYNNLGIVYRRIDRPEEAIEILQRSLRIMDPDTDEDGLVNIYINLGNCLTTLEKYDSAAIYFQKALTYANAVNDSLNFCYANSGLGIIAYNKKERRKAVDHLLQTIRVDVSERYVIYTALRYLASAYSELGQFDSAEFYFQKALPIYEEEEYPHEVKELYLHMAEHYERIGQDGQALKAFKRYSQMNNELISQNVIDRTAEWEERYKAQEKEKEIINLKLQNEEASLLAQQQTNQRNIFISISIVLSLIGGFSIYLYKTKQKTSLRLEEKNKLINQALTEKELLMKEVHHRVKNNLQVISSLLNLQSNFIADEKANAAVLESKNRVHSMALIHQRLYQHEDITSINLEEYLDQLIGNLEQSYCGSEKDIVIDLAADNIGLDVDKVILLGLIVNELVTNSIKYAFDQGVRGGVVDVSVRDLDGKIRLCVADNGKGMDAAPEIKQGSLGTLLIKDLSKKLNADLKYEFDKGTKVILVFEHQSAFA